MATLHVGHAEAATADDLGRVLADVLMAAANGARRAFGDDLDLGRRAHLDRMFGRAAARETAEVSGLGGEAIVGPREGAEHAGQVTFIAGPRSGSGVPFVAHADQAAS